MNSFADSFKHLYDVHSFIGLCLKLKHTEPPMSQGGLPLLHHRRPLAGVPLEPMDSDRSLVGVSPNPSLPPNAVVVQVPTFYLVAVLLTLVIIAGGMVALVVGGISFGQKASTSMEYIHSIIPKLMADASITLGDGRLAYLALDGANSPDLEKEREEMVARVDSILRQSHSSLSDPGVLDRSTKLNLYLLATNLMRVDQILFSAQSIFTNVSSLLNQTVLGDDMIHVEQLLFQLRMMANNAESFLQGIRNGTASLPIRIVG